MPLDHFFRSIGVTVTVAVTLFVVLSTCVSGEIYCVIPHNDTSTSCPETCLYCDTLSQYAAQPRDYFASNTSLVLQSGNHNLDSPLFIWNIDLLYIYPNTTSPFDVTVTCISNTPVYPLKSFGNFRNIDQINIWRLNFFGCVDNIIDSVNKVVLEDCNFHAEGRIGTGIDFSNVSSAEIIRNSFMSYNSRIVISFKGSSRQFNSHCDDIITSTYTGNFESDSMLVLRTCTFSNSYGMLTTSVYIFKAIALIYDSYFVNNTATAGTGGGVHLSDYSNIVITDCTFINNYAGNYGGAVGGSNTNGCVTIENSNFINNSAFYDAGAVYITSLENGFVTVNNSVFIDNRAEKVGSGAIQTKRGDVTIHNSVFIENMATSGCGALYIERSNTISIKNCTFVGNSALNFDVGYSNGGVVCVTNGLELELVDCCFVNNSADVGGVLHVVYIATRFDGEMVFVDNSAINGGVLFLEHVNLIVYDSLYIQNNIADSSVVYAINSSITVSPYSHWTVTNNIGFVYAFSSTIMVSGHLEISSNSFANRSNSSLPIVEGALTTHQTEVIFLGTVNIERNDALNGGGILAMESKVDFYGQVTIASNTALQSGGGIYAYQSELYFVEEVNITDNEANENGGGIHVISSTAKVVGGFLYIANNRAQNGGGMSLQLNSKLYLIKWEKDSINNLLLRLEFTNNFADNGGALYVFDDITSGGCATIGSTNTVASECFFQSIALYSDIANDPKIPNLLNTFFYNNTATNVGTSIYGGLLDRCRVSHFAEFFYLYKEYVSITFTDTISYLVNVTNIDIKNIQNDISSSPVRVCFCTQDGPDCSYHPPPFEVKKGKTFQVHLTAVDQVNKSIEAIVHCSLNSTNGGYIEKQTSHNVSAMCTYLEYSILSPHDSETLILYAEGPCKDIGVSSAPIHLKYKPCPIGFEDKDMKCDCDDKLLLPEFINSCSIDDETVLRKNNVWFSFENTTDYQGYILHNHCPFSYCHPPSESIHVDLNIEDGSDALCVSNRSQKLCGSCKEGLSLVFGSSRCKLCSNHWLALTLVFALAGVLLVVFLLLLNLTVSVGTICGLIFYANVIAANRNIFLPNFQTNVFTVFISWINLDFGFERCFFDGMDGYAKTWLQFVFPLYILALVVGVIKGCEYSSTFSNLLIDRKPVETLATLIYLSYAKLLRTIIAALSPTVLDGPQELVWLFDANVPYLRGKHIPLFIAAVLVVIAGLFYTGLLFFWQWIDQCSRTIPPRLSDFMRAYHAPYNKHHRYWIGLLPSVTAILYLVSAANVFGDPRVNLLSINSLIVGLLFYQLVVASFGKETEKTIHKNRLANVLENSFFLNLIGLTSVTYFITSDSETQYQIAVSYTSITIAFVTFIGILIYHVWTFNKKPLQQGWTKLIKSTRKATEINDLRGTSNIDEHQVLTQTPSETVIDRSIYSPLSSPRTTPTLKYMYGSLDSSEETSQHNDM